MKTDTSPDSRSGRLGVLNGKYPASYWLIAFSKDVRAGEAVPMRRLERDLVLWRDADGTLHCQDHACTQRLGRIGDRWSERDGVAVCENHADAFDGAQEYLVKERYGGVFVWSGELPADHDLPDILGQMGLTEDDVKISYSRFMLPYPVKWLIENEPDMAHFAFLHNTGDWGDCWVTDETESAMSVTGRIYGKRGLTPKEFARLYRRDDLTDIIEFSGDVVFEVYGSGISNLWVEPPDADAPRFSLTGPIGKAVQATRQINGLAPVDVDTLLIMLITFTPRFDVPVIGGLLDGLVAAGARARGWVAIRQDYPVMVHRDEPEGPRYNRLDRALVAYRKFWDRRLPDRTLEAGDNLHSNGRRAGIKWTHRHVGAEHTDVEAPV